MLPVRIRASRAADRPELLRMAKLLWPDHPEAEVEQDVDSWDPSNVLVAERGPRLGGFIQLGERACIEDRLEVIHFERQVAQPELVGHGGRRSRLVVWSDEARQFQPRTTVGRAQHDDLRTGVGDANDGVQKLALQERPALNLETQPDEEC